MSIFYVIKTIFDINLPNSYHKARLLKIKHFGEVRLNSMYEGDKRLFIIKYYISALKSFRNHVNKLDRLYKINHLKPPIQLVDIVVFKYIIGFATTLVLAVLLYSEYCHFTVFSDFLLLSAVYVCTFMLFIIFVFLIDTAILSVLFTLNKNHVSEQLEKFSNSFESAILCNYTLGRALESATSKLEDGMLKKSFTTAIEKRKSGLPMDIALKEMSDELEVEPLTDFLNFVRRMDGIDFDSAISFTDNYRNEFLRIKKAMYKETERALPIKYIKYNMAGLTANVMFALVPILFGIVQALRSY